jgi:hypothetical protein
MHAWCIWLVNKDIVGCLHRNRILPLGGGAPWWRQIDTHILQPRWQWQRHTKTWRSLHASGINRWPYPPALNFVCFNKASWRYISISIGSSGQLNIYDYVFWCCRIEAWQSSRSVSLLRSHPSVASYLIRVRRGRGRTQTDRHEM